jgi:hypothetical protein
VIITCFVRKPALTAVLVTRSAYEQAAMIVIEEIVLERFKDNPADAWTTEVRHWVPAGVNAFIQAATADDASTLVLNDEEAIAVVRAEVDDVILAAAQAYLARIGSLATVSLSPGISAAIKTEIDEAPHDEPT